MLLEYVVVRSYLIDDNCLIIPDLIQSPTHTNTDYLRNDMGKVTHIELLASCHTVSTEAKTLYRKLQKCVYIIELPAISFLVKRSNDMKMSIKQSKLRLQ